MSSKKKAPTTSNQVAQVDEQREKFVRALQKRIQDKNWYEIADGIVWAIEQVMSGADQEPDQEADQDTSPD